jgi:hypothetical protein
MSGIKATLGTGSVSYRIPPHLSHFWVGVRDTIILDHNAAYIILNFIETCNSHFRNKPTRRLNVSQQIQLLGLSLYFTGLFIIYYGFIVIHVHFSSQCCIILKIIDTCYSRSKRKLVRILNVF